MAQPQVRDHAPEPRSFFGLTIRAGDRTLANQIALMGCETRQQRQLGNPGEAEQDSAMKLNRIPG